MINRRSIRAAFLGLALVTSSKGYVTREEFLKFQEQFFSKMDRDRNGRISEVEWTDAG